MRLYQITCLPNDLIELQNGSMCPVQTKKSMPVAPIKVHVLTELPGPM
jgi:hypothetical protein